MGYKGKQHFTNHYGEDHGHVNCQVPVLTKLAKTIRFLVVVAFFLVGGLQH